MAVGFGIMLCNHTEIISEEAKKWFYTFVYESGLAPPFSLLSPAWGQQGFRGGKV